MNRSGSPVPTLPSTVAASSRSTRSRPSSYTIYSLPATPGLSEPHSEPVLPTRRPLDDVRILAIEQYGAGPWATQQLVSLGAEVIKIEDPLTRGDVGRYVPPFQEGEDSLFFETFNGGKMSVTLDLRAPAGREAFESLVACSDVVFSNLRGTGPATLKLRYSDLSVVNPRIVCCALTGFGMTGPRAEFGALDYVIQGLAGWMSLTGEPGSPPTRTGLSLVDFAAGYVAAIAILGALWRARRDGTGCDCDISLHETALSLLSYVATWTASRDYTPSRMKDSSHPSIVPFQNFATADGVIVVACPKQNLWEHFARAIGRGDLLEMEQYADLERRDRNRDTLVPTLAAVFSKRTTAEWLETLDRAGVPCGPVNDIATALEDPQVAARDGVETYRHERLGTVRRVRSPLRLSGPWADADRAPFLGEHNATTMRDVCGVSNEQLMDLARRGAFGPHLTDA